jgi:hypothetical protein
MQGDKFLTVAANLLHKALIEPSRVQAKGLFRQLQEGRCMPLTRLQLEDRSTVRFDLSLEHSAYVGRLTFGALRAGVSLLINNIGEGLRAGKTPPCYSSEHNPNLLLFGVTAVTVEDQKTSVLALGADLSRNEPVVELQLVYLDPSQFAVQNDGADADTRA